MRRNAEAEKLKYIQDMEDMRKKQDDMEQKQVVANANLEQLLAKVSRDGTG